MRFGDSNVFVYHLAGDPSHGARAEEIKWTKEDTTFLDITSAYSNDRDFDLILGIKRVF